ncbi:putative disease resistance protein [Cinnamomum micranthum f. kanehirae]|uniref:Putative disease resistance protein n=1 Tax=Cinnamomum micranthum f. kanehirae TaxID=337451 RepID=A0A443P268_9MAGN|nr:putative disease resistance protein [Cinnamomum micranthum f. kanehirae]
MAAEILFMVAEKLAQFLRVPNLSTAYSRIEWMETELRRVHELLKEDPGLEMNCKELRKWVRDLIHAAQNIEDIVDNFDFNLERRPQRMGCMGSAFFAVKGKVARYKIVAEVKQVKEKMSQICESMPNKQVFGFDKDFDALVKLLVEGNDPHPLSLFIVGPCGAGKTTLVKEVCDSDAVKKQFPYRFWFCVPEYKFWDRAFWEKMSTMVTGRTTTTTTIDVLDRISDALKGKRYLIVLDINLIYDRNIHPREDFISRLREVFPDEKNGSRVVVTCNDKKDADLFGQEIEVHELGMLSSEDKWKLFLNTWDFDAATAETTAGTSLSSGMLEEIVRRQIDLPSEIVNLGDLLSKENRKSSALSNIMLDHPNYYQVDGPERTLLKIASSFDLLESPLKLFFLCCSLFPKGFEIPTRRVIVLWLAEGWLQREDEWFYPAWKRPKSRVPSYLEELSHLGMIQVEYSYLQGRYSWEDYESESERIILEPPLDDYESEVERILLESPWDDYESEVERILLESPWDDYKLVVKRIRLESPAWDFAAMKAMQYNLSHNTDNEGPHDDSSSSNARKPCNITFLTIPTMKGLTTTAAAAMPRNVTGGEVTFPTSRFKLLRTLDLEDMYFITQLSEEIGELVHLRYLGLRRTGLYSLPNSIGKLKNLESLDIRGTRVKPIPTDAIQKLERLEYLYMDMDDGSTDDNDSLDVSSLRRLRVLSVIRAGRWMENGLGQLTNLTKLGMYGDLHDSRVLDRVLVRLGLRGSLRLGLGFGDIIPEDILPSLNSRIWTLYLERPLQKLPARYVFGTYLKKLCLKWSLLEQDPMKTLEQLRNLEVLKLRCGSFLGKKMVCSARGFPKLRFLELSLLDGLEEWTVEKGAMPKLKHLVIRLCNRLKELPQGLLHLHRIEKLEVAGMPNKFNARLQYNKGEDWDKIKHIKSVTVDGIQMAASSSSSSSSFQPYREISEIDDQLAGFLAKIHARDLGLRKQEVQGPLISINSGDITTPSVATSGLASSSEDGGMKSSSFSFLFALVL